MACDRTGRGPVVLAFHCGYWCDYCHLNVAALAGIGPRIEALGSQITPTFVLNGESIIVARHLDPDPRTRMDCDAIVQAALICQSAARSWYRKRPSSGPRWRPATLAACILKLQSGP